MNRIGTRRFYFLSFLLLSVIFNFCNLPNDKNDYALLSNRDEWSHDFAFGSPSWDTFEHFPNNPVYRGRKGMEWPVNGFLNSDPVSGNWYLYIGEYKEFYGFDQDTASADFNCVIYESADKGKTWNKKGDLFLQKRASTKDLLPGYWDTSVGGHVSPGESSEQALKREVLEEIGLTDFDFAFVTRYIWESLRERELVYVYKGTSEKEPVINKDEIEEGRFWKIGEIRERTGDNIFTPNFENEFLSIIGKE